MYRNCLLAMTVWATLSVSAIAQDEHCSARWAEGETTGAAVYYGFMRGLHTVVVDEGGWQAMDYAGKQNLVATFNCTFSSGSATEYPIEFLSSMTNHRLALWEPAAGLTVF